MSVTQKMYALVGNFGFHPRPKGIGVYRYDPATSGMELVETAFDEVNVGHITVDAERKIVYATNEISNLRGQIGGGGYVLALAIDPASGKLSLVNEKATLSGKPCYTYLDKTKHYLLVSHHGDSGFVTKIVRNEKGFSTVTVFDDNALVLFRVNPDGSLGEVCDVALTPGADPSGPHSISHLHSVIADPTGELFIIPDKGLDTIHTFHLDRVNGRLIQLADTLVETGMSPRYGVFHPTLPIFYANFEQKTVVCVYRYDISSGKLELIGTATLLVDERAVESLKKAEATDILIHPNGRYMYASVRGTNTIAMLDVDVEGALSLRENIHCGGDSPRGLCISPDERFLFAANVASVNIAVFSIGADGALCATGTGVSGRCPGIIRFLAV
jgi:6-phosphogluconolactonase